MTTRRIAEMWVSRRVRTRAIAPLTARNQRSHLNYLVAAIGPDRDPHFDRLVLARWLESIGHLAPATRRSHLSTARVFLTDLVADGMLPGRVLDLLPKQQAPRAVPRALTKMQVKHLLRSLPDQRSGVIVGLMLWCGLRCAEVANLKVEDVDERSGTVFVKGKGGHERVVCIPDEFAPTLSAWLDVRRRVSGPLVLNRWGRAFGADTVSMLVSRWMAAAGVKVAVRDGRSAHALRHTCASDVLDAGASIRTVQAILGHVNLATTSVYLRRAQLDDLRRAMNGRDYAA